MLDLSSNQLTYLPGYLGNLTNLEEANLSSNSFSVFPGTIFRWKKLRVLNLSNNKLKVLPPWFKKNIILTHVDLSSNFLGSVPLSWGKLKSLTYFDLSRNNFKYISLSFKTLQKKGNISINLFNNPLGKLPNYEGKISILVHPSTNSSVFVKEKKPVYSYDLTLQGIYYAQQSQYLLGENVKILIIEYGKNLPLIPMFASLSKSVDLFARSVLPDHAQKVGHIIVAPQSTNLRIPIAPAVNLNFLNCESSPENIRGVISRFQNGNGRLINISYRNIEYPPQLITFPGLIIKAIGNETKTFKEREEVFYNLMKSSKKFCSHVILVGALDCSGHRLSSYTNTPGEDEDIYSRTLFATGGDNKKGEELSFKIAEANDLTYSSGTSFAAPLVTGALALLQEKYKYKLATEEITMVDIGNLLLKTADPFRICNKLGKLIRNPQIIGQGRLNLTRALKEAEKKWG